MKLDELDVFITRSIYEAYQKKTASNHWEMAKDYAKINNIKDINNLYRRIKARLDCYCKIGLFSMGTNGNGEPTYEMNLNRITFKKQKEGKKFKECLLIRIPL